MAIPESGGGGGVDAGFIPLLDFLRDKLGGYFFERDGMGTEDIAYLNLIRLRALFENTGEPSTLLQTVDTTQADNLLTVHDAAFGTDSDRISSAVNALFGQPGRININLGGNELPDGTEASVSVRNQWTDMQRLGSPDEVANRDYSPPPTGVAAPGDDSGGVDYIEGGVADTPRPTPGVESATGGDPAPAGGAPSGGTPSVPLDDTLEPGTGESGGQRQIPGGEELWRVGGRDVYLVYKIPGTNTPLAWKVENPERLSELYDGNVPAWDRELSPEQWKKQSPVVGGLSTEIMNTNDDPWQVFLNRWNEQTELRPWQDDPTFMAATAVAYFEGREITRDELSQTDWWNEHTEDERAWLEASVTLGSKEVKRRKRDATLAVEQALREAGMNNVPRRVAEFIATQRLTGKWSEEYTSQQVRKLSDPHAPGNLDRGILAAIRDPNLGEVADARAVSQGRAAVRDRVRAIFENRAVPIGTDGESEDQRLNRIAREILDGERTFSDVRNSVDWLAARTEGGRPGGLDVTSEQEDRVRELSVRWLGSKLGEMSQDSLSEWAGRLRNDPDAEQELIEHLKGERRGLFPNYDPNLTFEQVVAPVRNLAVERWGQPIHDESMLVDLANKETYTEMDQWLRTEGRKRGIAKVVNDMYADLASTPLGDRVVRSAI